MTLKLTPEVASAHKNLRDLCERFETSVDEFCASPLQSLRTQDFYESECVSIAGECVDALSKFQSARSYEVTVYERRVAAAENALREQKRELEENATQRAKTYENVVAAANNALRQEKQKWETDAVQRATVYERAVAVVESTFHLQKREREENADRNIRDIEYECQRLGVQVHISRTEGETTTNASSKIPYKLALQDLEAINKKDELNKKEDDDSGGCLAILLFNPFTICIYILGGFVFFGHRAGETVLGRSITFGQYFQPVWETAGLFLGVPSIIFVLYKIISVLYNKWNRNRKSNALKTLRDAAKAERDIICKEMERAVAEASAARDQKVKEAQERKEREDKDAAKTEANTIREASAARDQKVKEAQERKEREDKDAAKTEANTIWEASAARDQKVKEARSIKDSVLAYILQEHQSYDLRLCQCLDKLQSFLDPWATEKTVDVRNKIQFQNLNQNDEQIAPHLTRIGSVGVWELIENKEGK